jgi:single-strand DNA-binding protein
MGGESNKSMNNVTLAGRLTRDPELKFVGQKGTALCNFSIAVNEKTGDKEVTNYFDCKCWSGVAEAATSALHKGSPVVVVGRLDQETWDDKQTGAKRSKIVVIASVVAIPLFKKADGAPVQPAPTPAPKPDPASPPAPTDDDVPF